MKWSDVIDMLVRKIPKSDKKHSEFNIKYLSQLIYQQNDNIPFKRDLILDLGLANTKNFAIALLYGEATKV